MRIRYDERALLFYYGKFIRVQHSGFFLNWKGYTVERHQINTELHTSGDPATLLADDTFKTLTETVELLDNNIALYFEDGVFQSVLTAGIHIFWKTERKRTFIVVDLNNPEIDDRINRRIFTHAALLPYVTSYTVEAYEKGLLFFDKRFIKILEAGNYFFWKGNQSVNIIKADMRIRQLEVSGQEILTKDKILLRLNFVCQYKITDPVTALINTADYEKQLYVCLQLALREYIGVLLFDELLQKKEEINTFILNTVKMQAEAFGIALLTAGLKDIILPGEIRNIINQVLVAEKRAQANIITRREETASTRSLLNTAKLMEENALLLKLKEWEYVDKISEKINQISLTGSGHVLDQLKELFTGTRPSQ